MSPQADLLARIVACGVNPEGVSVRYEAFLQSEVITLAASSGLQEQHFDCLYSATRGAFVEIADARLGSSYQAFAEEKAQAWMLAEATKWLKDHNKLEGVPRFSRGDDVGAWVRCVERFCGFGAGEALEVLSSTRLAIKPITVEEIADPRQHCLSHVLTLSDLKKNGVELGFIGNAEHPQGRR